MSNFRDFEKRIAELELQAPRDEPAPEPTPLGAWVSSIPSGALMRIEMLMEALSGDPDLPLGEVERALIEVVCLDGDGDVDENRRWLSDWSVSDERRFLGGADLSMFFTWIGVDIAALTGGELHRLMALLRLVEDHGLKPPPRGVIQAVLGWGEGHAHRRVV